MATWDDVASVVGELQLTEERSPHEWRVGKKLIAWERPLRKSDYDALTAVGVEPPQGDILGVRVADEAVVVGDGDAAEHHRVARAEAVRVDPLADPHGARRAGHQPQAHEARNRRRLANADDDTAFDADICFVYTRPVYDGRVADD